MILERLREREGQNDFLDKGPGAVESIVGTLVVGKYCRLGDAFTLSFSKRPE
jgi:hypothetical protein